MALTAVVTKNKISKIRDKVYSVGMNLELLDDGVSVFTKSYNTRIIEGSKIDTTIFQEMMQMDIDQYNKEQTILTETELDTDATNIQKALILTLSAEG